LKKFLEETKKRGGDVPVFAGFTNVDGRPASHNPGTCVNFKKYVYVICPSCEGLFGTHVPKEANRCPFCEVKFTPKKGKTPGQYYI